MRGSNAFLCSLAAAALAACGGSSGGTDEGYVPVDPGGRIDICYSGDCGTPEDVPVTPTDGVEPFDTTPTDGTPADTTPPVDHGQDATPPVDPGTPDTTPPNDPGPVDTYVDPGPPCEYPVSTWGLRDNCDGTMLHTKTGRTWMKGEGFSAALDTARTYCSDLNVQKLGGYNDWHLPTIDELRELVIGCDAKTGTGGACPVHSTTINTALRTSDCDGCGINQGPAEKPGDAAKKCYMDNTFEWYCNLYWSNTQVQATSAGDKRSWYLTFYDAAINVPNPGEAMGSAAVKCVRGP